MILKNMPYLFHILLIALPVLILFFWYERYRRKTAEKLGQVTISSKRLFIKTVLVTISLLLFIFTLLRPQWGERERTVQNEGTDLVIGLDVSLSMMAKDVSPDRLTRAKNTIKWIVEHHKGGRVALIVFAGTAFLQCPLTADIGSFMMFLDSAGPDSVKNQGTNMGALFEKAAQVFEKNRLTTRVFTLITDGEDHEGRGAKMLGKMKELGVSVYALGIGTDDGAYIPSGGEVKPYLRDEEGTIIRSKRNPSLLARMASETGGAYIDISKNFGGLSALTKVIGEEPGEKKGERTVKEREDKYHIFTLLLLLVLLGELFIPEGILINGARRDTI